MPADFDLFDDELCLECDELLPGEYLPELTDEYYDELDDL